ncbi:hypothetical protein B2J93_5068 [Marssonina coronariae]|uniref:Uncharacterized protein n=1 Tax=Diplocarpon coronariae TaxID=2795749 RepID=A0A218ZET9_9HELO|nr:hypothetical protein B2J93_5068 [Marssonina coronariae]
MQFSASLTKVVVLAMASLSMAEDPPNACVYSQSKKDAACVPGAGDLFCTGTHFHTICEPGMFPAFDLGAIKKNDNRATGWQEVGTGSQDEDEDEDEDEDIPPALDPSHFSVWLAGRGSTGTDSASAAFAADMRASPKAHYS